MDFDLELVGAWSADALYDAGAQADEVVVFKNDGTGWIAVSNFGLGNVDLFRWDPTSPGWIYIGFTRSYELLGGGRSREIETSRDDLHIPFSVTTEIAPNEQEMRVLRIEVLSFGDNTFGLLEADSSRLQAPF